MRKTVLEQWALGLLAIELRDPAAMVVVSLCDSERAMTRKLERVHGLGICLCYFCVETAAACRIQSSLAMIMNGLRWVLAALLIQQDCIRIYIDPCSAYINYRSSSCIILQ